MSERLLTIEELRDLASDIRPPVRAMATEIIALRAKRVKLVGDVRQFLYIYPNHPHAAPFRAALAHPAESGATGSTWSSEHFDEIAKMGDARFGAMP